jgi:preprotein translocase subunit SecG
MQSVIIVIHLMIVATLIAAVLLQKSEGGGLGVGGGGGFMSSRGTANLLTRTTGILAAGFFITSMFLSWLAAYERKPNSVIVPDSAPISQPGAPMAPPTSGGLLDSLRKSDQQQAPAAPAGPQAPRSQ